LRGWPLLAIDHQENGSRKSGVNDAIPDVNLFSAKVSLIHEQRDI
jgi:hypothetical protein